MDIKYIGHASFLRKGKTATVITDPFDPKMTGLSFPSLSADIVTVSHEHKDHNYVKGIEGDPLIIRLPGEYEKKGVRVSGMSTFHDDKNGKDAGRNTMFSIEIDGVHILHCGDLGHALSDEMVEEMEQVDVLLVPTGGTYTISADEAVEVIKAIEPSFVIPMHYFHKKLKEDVFGKLSPVSTFLEKIGHPDVVPVRKLTVKKEDCTGDMKVVLMEY